MQNQQIVTINGVRYDALSGVRLSNTSPQAKPRAATKALAAKSMHKKTAHSKTLSRKHVSIPIKKSNATPSTPRRSPMVRKFADINPSSSGRSQNNPHSPVKKKSQTPPDIPPVNHPIQPQPHSVTTPPVQKTASQIKQREIERALSTPTTPKLDKEQSFLAKYRRIIGLSSVGVAVLALAGYFAYANLPNLAVQVASMQAGINASYPTYQPSGYGMRTPVKSSDGQVSMEYTADTGPQTYTVTQVKSSWDSSALLQNYVKGASSGSYTTYNESGLTIYTYGTNAAWVSGGILYTIKGNAPLSSDQIRKIATSM